MANEHEWFHGSPGDNILSIIRDRSMRPDASHKLYFSHRYDDAFQHGADLKRRAAFAFKAKVTLPSGASVVRESRPGNPIAIIVTTVQPLATQILELYVRRPNEPKIEVIKGVEVIKAYLA
jgi:hypothetical protein